MVYKRPNDLVLFRAKLLIPYLMLVFALHSPNESYINCMISSYYQISLYPTLLTVNWFDLKSKAEQP